ncbi:hypothetical protein Tco_1351863 [Tanacetum coccineum]
MKDWPMDKEVADKVKDHKRKHDSDDDDDEGPSAGSNQGKLAKRRRHDSGASGSAQPLQKTDELSSKKPRKTVEQSSDNIPMQDEGHADRDLLHLDLNGTIPPNDFPEPENNWANTYATTYKVPEENKLQRKTYDIGSFIKWSCQCRNKKEEAMQVDLEGPAFNLFLVGGEAGELGLIIEEISLILKKYIKVKDEPGINYYGNEVDSMVLIFVASSAVGSPFNYIDQDEQSTVDKESLIRRCIGDPSRSNFNIKSIQEHAIWRYLDANENPTSIRCERTRASNSWIMIIAVQNSKEARLILHGSKECRYELHQFEDKTSGNSSTKPFGRWFIKLKVVMEEGNVLIESFAPVARVFVCLEAVRIFVAHGSTQVFSNLSDESETGARAMDHAGTLISKMHSGGIQFLGDKLVKTDVKETQCTAMSSAGAEYYSDERFFKSEERMSAKRRCPDNG